MTFVIKTKGVTKIARGRNILEDITLEIPKASIFGIIGKSGAGKSSLLKCLSSLDIPSKGTVEVLGKTLHRNGIGLRSIRKKLGMIFQNFELLNSRSAEKNIALPLELDKIDKEKIEKKVEKLLNIVGLSACKDLYPSQLSGGQKQRVAIARAIARNPSIVFCDEATSALDPQTTKEILQLLSTLNKELGITLVIVSHEMEVIRKICSHIAVIDEGKIVEIGKALDLLSAPAHPVTKHLLKNSSHEIDVSTLVQDKSLLVLSLHFKGAAAERPILSQMLKEIDLEVNILAGWIDRVENTSLGSLTVAIRGPKEKALAFLKENGVLYEVLS